MVPAHASGAAADLEPLRVCQRLLRADAGAPGGCPPCGRWARCNQRVVGAGLAGAAEEETGGTVSPRNGAVHDFAGHE